MAIVSSTYTVGHEQADARRYVREQHTDSNGVVYPVEYLAAVGTNYQSVADARAVSLAAMLAEQEFGAIVNG